MNHQAAIRDSLRRIYGVEFQERRVKPVWLSLEKASMIVMLIDSKGVFTEDGGREIQSGLIMLKCQF